MVYIHSEEKKKKSFQKSLDLIKKRGHVFVEGTYENRDSKLVVFCPLHEQKHETTFYNYERSVTGMPCCGKKSSSYRRSL
jgi:hypothetical protein